MAADSQAVIFLLTASLPEAGLMCSRQILVSMIYGWRSGHQSLGQSYRHGRIFYKVWDWMYAKGRSGFSKVTLLEWGGGLWFRLRTRCQGLECQLWKEKCISHYFSLADSIQTYNNDIAVPVSQLHAEEVSSVLGSHSSLKRDFFPLFCSVSHQ